MITENEFAEVEVGDIVEFKSTSAWNSEICRRVVLEKPNRNHCLVDMNNENGRRPHYYIYPDTTYKVYTLKENPELFI